MNHLDALRAAFDSVGEMLAAKDAEIARHKSEIARVQLQRDQAQARLDLVVPSSDELDSVMSLLNWTRQHHDRDSMARKWLEAVVDAALAKQKGNGDGE